MPRGAHAHDSSTDDDDVGNLRLCLRVVRYERILYINHIFLLPQFMTYVILSRLSVIDNPNLKVVSCAIDFRSEERRVGKEGSCRRAGGTSKARAERRSWSGTLYM